MKIAALLTCHNRRDKTIACLEGLAAQTGVEDDVQAFVVDDGSTDGTSEAVAGQFPEARLLSGDGSLFWNGGMRMAMSAAADEDFDYYLWLNDDTALFPDALERLLATHDRLASEHSSPIIVVGSIRDPETGDFTYGGPVRSSRWATLRFRHILPGSDPVACDVFNGNCVLIPRAAAKIAGNLHPELVHTAGDCEYGLRAARRGVSSFVAPGCFGECGRNSEKGTWLDPGLPLAKLYRLLFSQKGHAPGPRLRYHSEYGGPFWSVMCPLVYLRPLISSLKHSFRPRNRDAM